MCRGSFALSPDRAIILIRAVVENPLAVEDGQYFLDKTLRLQTSPTISGRGGEQGSGEGLLYETVSQIVFLDTSFLGQVLEYRTPEPLILTTPHLTSKNCNEIPLSTHSPHIIRHTTAALCDTRTLKNHLSHNLLRHSVVFKIWNTNLLWQLGVNIRRASCFHHGHTDECGFCGILSTTPLSANIVFPITITQIG